MRRLALALLSAALFAFPAAAQNAYVTLDGNGNVTGVFAEPQASPAPAGYAVISASDARLTTFATEQANLAEASSLGQSLTIACAGGATVCTSGITGTYGLSQQQQFFITAEAVSIAQNGTFTNGTSSKTWPDASNAMHTFTVAQWKEFDTAVAAYVDGLNAAVLTIEGGGSPTWPSQTASLN